MNSTNNDDQYPEARNQQNQRKPSGDMIHLVMMENYFGNKNGQNSFAAKFDSVVEIATSDVLTRRDANGQCVIKLQMGCLLVVGVRAASKEAIPMLRAMNVGEMSKVIMGFMSLRVKWHWHFLGKEHLPFVEPDVLAVVSTFVNKNDSRKKEGKDEKKRSGDVLPAPQTGWKKNPFDGDKLVAMGKQIEHLEQQNSLLITICTRMSDQLIKMEDFMTKEFSAMKRNAPSVVSVPKSVLDEMFVGWDEAFADRTSKLNLNAAPNPEEDEEHH